jgi:hypothetical protein
MARKFLYAVVVLVVLAIGVAFALQLFPGALTRAALVPTSSFEQQEKLAGNTYADPAMWFSLPETGPETGPGTRPDDPSRWLPPGVSRAEEGTRPVAVFFVHPTSYLERARWNAPLDDAQSQARARLFLRGMASAFGAAEEIWAPRYRQATFGAFLTDKPEGRMAIDAAYADVELAFDRFLESIGPDTPIVLAGHSQGALHVLRLLRERVAGTPLQARIAMAYPIGWPISLMHDLPMLGLPACETAEDAGCIVSWSSFAEPADPGDWLALYGQSPGFDGQVRGDSAILCVNPLTGQSGGDAPASANLGTLKPSADLTSGELVPGAVGARCDERGLLLIGDPPDLGPYVLPGNNYHVYDIPLFWANLRQDFERRTQAWAAAAP